MSSKSIACWRGRCSRTTACAGCAAGMAPATGHEPGVAGEKRLLERAAEGAVDAREQGLLAGAFRRPERHLHGLRQLGVGGGDVRARRQLARVGVHQPHGDHARIGQAQGEFGRLALDARVLVAVGLRRHDGGAGRQVHDLRDVGLRQVLQEPGVVIRVARVGQHPDPVQRRETKARQLGMANGMEGPGAGPQCRLQAAPDLRIASHDHVARVGIAPRPGVGRAGRGHWTVTPLGPPKLRVRAWPDRVRLQVTVWSDRVHAYAETALPMSRILTLQ
jgi:hypothetical protein